MKTENWLTAAEACTQLGVRRQTLYAYASRKMLRVRADPNDPRRSLYAAQDVVHLAETSSRSRARADVAAGSIRWGDPVLETSISGIHNDTLYFGNQPAVSLARRATLEEIAARHMGRTTLEKVALGQSWPGDTPMARGLTVLTDMAALAPAIAGRGPAALARDGTELLARFADALIGPGADLIHLRCQSLWGLEPAAGQVIRRALVLLSDHELNPSTFAVRVCASTGASLAACALAGLATLSGPKHGGVAGKTLEGLRAARSGQFAVFVEAHAGLSPYGYGFGHPLYSGGDPRAETLLNVLDTDVARTIAEMSAFLGVPPNIDAALAAITCSYDLPKDAAFTIFALARMTGWIAHAIEQSQNGQMIRPRARFEPK